MTFTSGAVVALGSAPLAAVTFLEGVAWGATTGTALALGAGLLVLTVSTAFTGALGFSDFMTLLVCAVEAAARIFDAGAETVFVAAAGLAAAGFAATVLTSEVLTIEVLTTGVFAAAGLTTADFALSGLEVDDFALAGLTAAGLATEDLAIEILAAVDLAAEGVAVSELVLDFAPSRTLLRDD